MTTFCEPESVLGDTISSFRKRHSTNRVLMDHLPSSIGSFQRADDTTVYSNCPAPELQRCTQELNSTLNTVSSKPDVTCT
ncbi:unnamed protein product [Porites evermanni]|uniref:Uncharacterized protein n=1 Tax=Porites evermanni TaxID=104178 RepID=A0ABN8LTE6_9CNID|nr:unnamed protein product [Porites evermanni]